MKKNVIHWLEIAASLLLFFFLAFYVYAYLFEFPYYGFLFASSTGEVAEISTMNGENAELRVGDRILSIQGQKLADLTSDWRSSYLHYPDEKISLLIEREGQQLAVEWILPGFNSSEFFSRFFNSWWIGIAFWFIGTLTILFIRPRDARRNLLAALCYVTAIWLVTGTVSRTHLYQSPFVMSAAFWLTFPIYIHFHWHFPKTLFGKMNPIMWIALYLIALLGAILQWLVLIPGPSYIFPFSLAILGSGLMLAFRLIWRREERGEIRILLLAFIISVLPAIVIALANVYGTLSLALYGAIVSLLALPGSYFYLIYRKQLGKLQFRVNRLISIYLYSLLLTTIIFALFPISPFRSFSSREEVGLIALMAVFIAFITALSFEPFQRFVEQRILNIPVHEKSLIEEFSRSISTSITYPHLEKVLTSSILPSLLIRESAILAFNEKGERAELMASHGLNSEVLELLHQLQENSLVEFEESQTLPQSRFNRAELSWVNLSLKINSTYEQNAYWLLGRKDPDDFYNQAEIQLLTILAGQLSIALVNIEQASKLRALYQRDINIQDEDRKNLARDLHDDVLNRLAALYMKFEDKQANSSLQASYQELVGYLRSKIHDLRPPMLNFGIWASLAELVDEAQPRTNGDVQIDLRVEKATHRFPPIVEEHIFRIMQQALENAIRHAGATKISIEGGIDENSLSLHLSDNGSGISMNGAIDLVDLLSKRHFGLAGMMERAELIKAKFAIQSALAKGTQISVEWKDEGSVSTS